MKKSSSLTAPWLKRVWLDYDSLPENKTYPFNLPLLASGLFDLRFEKPITIFVGENGAGKSTVLESIAIHCGFDRSGGGAGYMPVRHESALEKSAADLAAKLKSQWLPMVKSGWYFKADTFFAVARYLDEAALSAFQPPPDFLSRSHGESFLRFFGERCTRRGLFILDEPEAALSPARQIELLKLLKDIQDGGQGQVLIATHSPILMALPGADLWEIWPDGVSPVKLEDTQHFRFYRRFFEDPENFIEDAVRYRRED